uniref:Uncharacterized protein n=1 Tax=Tanacetum cinerariifolium TaxID=118510 RepID=A0A699H7D3_TANCI|nr:hypothetical protein [Tanacetum cinerariifolium]
MKGAHECMRIFGFKHGVNNPELTKRLNKHVPKTIEEMMITTTAFIRGEAAATSKKKSHTSWRTHDQSKRKTSEKRYDFRGHPKEGRGSSRFTPLQGHQKKFLRPKQIEELSHLIKILSMDETSQREITFPPLTTSSRAEGPLVIEAKIGGHMIHRMYVEGSSSMKILYEHCFNQLRPEVKNQMVLVTTSLTGFRGETIWPLGQLRLLVTIGDADHSTRAWMNFMIVRSLSPYNGIIGRPRIKDCYPLPEIDCKVESLCGYPFKCFLDAYKGYHQIQLAESDVEKTAFHTGQGVYYNTKMPFGLKNAGATYQRLVDKAFDSQIAEGVFLGYMVTPDGIRPCPDKTTAVLQLSSPRTIKEKCIKKSEFHWTLEAKQAFKQIKQHLSELPLLVAPKPKEELIVYLSASYGAISAVLMTERGAIQTPVYFVSRALQGLELNYTPMEKLVLSLVFTSKRLRRYFQVHPIALLADFLAEVLDESPPAASVVETQQEQQALFMDGSSCVDRSGAGLILTSPVGTEFIYALRFQFAASNNEAEYEALIAGLRITTQMGVQNVHEGGKKAPHQGPSVRIIGGGSLQAVIPYAVVKMQAKALATITDSQVKKFVWDNIVYHFGLPGEIVSDNDKQFNDNPFKDCLGKGIKARLGEGNKNCVEELPHVLWAHCAMIKSSHGDTPFSLTYGTEAVILAEIGMPTYRTAAVDIVYNDEELRLNLDLLEERREHAAIREAKAKLKMTKYYNVMVRGVTFTPSDFVYRSNDASQAVDGGKLGPKWEGPYEVTEALRDGAYKL